MSKQSFYLLFEMGSFFSLLSRSENVEMHKKFDIGTSRDINNDWEIRKENESFKKVL